MNFSLKVNYNFLLNYKSNLHIIYRLGSTDKHKEEKRKSPIIPPYRSNYTGATAVKTV